MPYYLSSKQDQQLRGLLLKDFSASERIGSIIAGSDMSKKYDELLSEYMEKSFKDDPKEFHNKYVKLNFSKDEAEIEFSTLLNTYRIANPWLKIQRRSFEEELVADYEGELLQFPFGKRITLEVLGEVHRGVIDFLRVKNRIAFTFEININKIQKITGSIENYFDVYLEKDIIRFDYINGIFYRT